MNVTNAKFEIKDEEFNKFCLETTKLGRWSTSEFIGLNGMHPMKCFDKFLWGHQAKQKKKKEWVRLSKFISIYTPVFMHTSKYERRLCS